MGDLASDAIDKTELLAAVEKLKETGNAVYCEVGQLVMSHDSLQDLIAHPPPMAAEAFRQHVMGRISEVHGILDKIHDLIPREFHRPRLKPRDPPP